MRRIHWKNVVPRPIWFFVISLSTSAVLYYLLKYMTNAVIEIYLLSPKI